jgi:uncharacterized metal-binding protein YceD (DUF177 family)
MTRRPAAPLTEDASMKIYVNRVPEEGLSEHATYQPAEMDMERFDIKLPEPFEVDATVNLADTELVVQADIRAALAMTCARCLEEFRVEVAPHAIFSYQVQPTDVVDITDDVRQEIILSYPMIPVCRPDCKGLCRYCGQNLNVGTCSHQADAPRERGA